MKVAKAGRWPAEYIEFGTERIGIVGRVQRKRCRRRGGIFVSLYYFTTGRYPAL
jgi:hypothetical protein